MHAIFIVLSIYVFSLRSIKFEEKKMHAADEGYIFCGNSKFLSMSIKLIRNIICIGFLLILCLCIIIFTPSFFLHEKFFIFYVIFLILRNLYFPLQFSTKTGFCYCSFCSKYIVLKNLAQTMSQPLKKKKISLYEEGYIPQKNYVN